MGILAQLRESVDPAIVYWLFCVLKLCIRVLDFFMDLTFGYTITHGSRRERAAAANKYESSAQVVRVVARAGYCLVLNHELHNFCWAHEKYAHPEIVLGSDRILMFGFNETHAFFTVSREDLYDCEKFPFLFVVQFERSERLVIMPHSSFHRLAAELGDPGPLMAYVNMTARCGSTLLNQVMHRVPGVRSISEAYGMLHLHYLYIQRIIGIDGYKKLLKSYFRILCKKEHEKDIELIFIKGISLTGTNSPLVKELFPSCKLIYNTRHPGASNTSLMKVMTNQSFISTHLTSITRNWLYDRRAVPYDLPEWDGHSRRWHPSRKRATMDERLAFNYAAQTVDFMNHRDIYDMVIFYEDLAANSEAVTRRLLEILDIPLKHLPLAMEAFGSDSQKNVICERGYKTRVKSGASLERVEAAMKELGCPVWPSMETEKVMKILS